MINLDKKRKDLGEKEFIRNDDLEFGRREGRRRDKNCEGGLDIS